MNVAELDVSMLDCREQVEDLADVAKMSVPSFHRHFKQITAMSPIQFQKQLRLQEARQLLMMEESLNVADIVFRVGYESPTQFIREYSRMFVPIYRTTHVECCVSLVRK